MAIDKHGSRIETRITPILEEFITVKCACSNVLLPNKREKLEGVDSVIFQTHFHCPHCYRNFCHKEVYSLTLKSVQLYEFK